MFKKIYFRRKLTLKKNRLLFKENTLKTIKILLKEEPLFFYMLCSSKVGLSILKQLLKTPGIANEITSCISKNSLCDLQTNKNFSFELYKISIFNKYKNIERLFKQEESFLDKPYSFTPFLNSSSLYFLCRTNFAISIMNLLLNKCPTIANKITEEALFTLVEDYKNVKNTLSSFLCLSMFRTNIYYKVLYKLIFFNQNIAQMITANELYGCHKLYMNSRLNFKYGSPFQSSCVNQYGKSFLRLLFYLNNNLIEALTPKIMFEDCKLFGNVDKCSIFYLLLCRWMKSYDMYFLEHLISLNPNSIKGLTLKMFLSSPNAVAKTTLIPYSKESLPSIIDILNPTGFFARWRAHDLDGFNVEMYEAGLNRRILKQIFKQNLELQKQIFFKQINQNFYKLNTDFYSCFTIKDLDLSTYDLNEKQFKVIIKYVRNNCYIKRITFKETHSRVYEKNKLIIESYLRRNNNAYDLFKKLFSSYIKAGKNYIKPDVDLDKENFIKKLLSFAKKATMTKKNSLSKNKNIFTKKEYQDIKDMISIVDRNGGSCNIYITHFPPKIYDLFMNCSGLNYNYYKNVPKISDITKNPNNVLDFLFYFSRSLYVASCTNNKKIARKLLSEFFLDGVIYENASLKDKTKVDLWIDMFKHDHFSFATKIKALLLEANADLFYNIFKKRNNFYFCEWQNGFFDLTFLKSKVTIVNYFTYYMPSLSINNKYLIKHDLKLAEICKEKIDEKMSATIMFDNYRNNEDANTIDNSSLSSNILRINDYKNK